MVVTALCLIQELENKRRVEKEGKGRKILQGMKPETALRFAAWNASDRSAKTHHREGSIEPPIHSQIIQRPVWRYDWNGSGD